MNLRRTTCNRAPRASKGPGPLGGRTILSWLTDERGASTWFAACMAVAALLLLAVFVLLGAALALPASGSDSSAGSLSGRLMRGGVGRVVGRVMPTAESPQARVDRLLGVTDERLERAPSPGAARGMSVIVIQVEALQTSAMDAQVDGQPLTPSLNRLAKRSWYFPNTYSQAGRGATSDAEFVANTGQYPPGGEPAAVLLADRAIPSVPRALGRAGYETVTMHVNDARFWNRTQLYPGLGFGSFLDQSYFGKDDSIGWGQSDELFFALATDPIGRLSAESVPYYVQLVTITSHHPFTSIPADRDPLPLTPKLEGTTVGRYAQSINYVDRAIGDFIDRLEADGVLDNAVLVIYGDHTALNPQPKDKREAAALAALFGDEYTRRDASRVPLIVQLPGQRRGERIESTFGQADIAPTVSELLDVPIDADAVFGASVFRVREHPVVPSACRSPYGSFITEDAQFVPVDDGDTYRRVPSDSDDTVLSDADVLLVERARALLDLSTRATSMLPERGDAGEIAGNAILPPAGRRALARIQGTTPGY